MKFRHFSRVLVLATVVLAATVPAVSAARLTARPGPSSSEVELSGLLNGDGTFRGSLGASGSVDLAHWRLVSDITHGEAPRFVPAASTSTSSLVANAWNAIGSNGAGNGALNGVVYAVAVSGANVYVGGDWFQAPGLPVAANNIAKWDGTSWSALSSDQNGPSPITGPVHAIVPSGTTVYVGGSFSNAGGVPNADNLARWDGNGWLAVGTPAAAGTGAIQGEVDAIAVSGTNLFVGGYFFHAGYTGAINGVTMADMGAWWNGSTWLPLGSGWGPMGHYPPLNARVNALLVDGPNLYVGTDTQNINGDPTLDFAGQFEFDNFVWHSMDSNLGNGSLNASVRALAVSGTSLYVGGDFTNADGISGANYLAKWNTGTGVWSAAGSTSPNSTVRSIVVSGSNVYVGGSFTDLGGATGDRLARWNGSSWVPLGSNGSGDGALNNSVYALALSTTALYAGGFFNNAAGNQTADYVAAYGLASAGQQKPDGRIKKGTGTLIGNNVYNTTGLNQTRTGSGSPGKTFTFTVSIQNDGTGAGKFYVRATGTAVAGYAIKYFRGTTDITTAVNAGTYQTASIAVGSTFGVQAKVTIQAGAAIGSSVNRLVTVKSVADGSKVDAVKFVVSRA
jgi:hypothetical protein